MLVERQEPQVRAARAVVAPCGPGGEKVVAEPESGFEHDEVLAPGPALRQPIAGQEHEARLFERTAARVIEIVELDRTWSRRIAEVDARRRQRPAHPLCADSQRSKRSRTAVRPRYSSTASLIDASASCTRCLRSGSLSASASGCTSTWIVNTACAWPSTGMKVWCSVRHHACAASASPSRCAGDGDGSTRSG